MPNYNIIHTVKIDEVGKTIDFTLEDDDGPFDLTNYTVVMNLAKGSTVVTSAASCTKRTQSGATLGQCYHTWAANTIPDAKGDYKGELKLTYGSNVLYWPTDKNGERTYFTVRVQEALT
jgi:hypothetical protein